MTTRTLTSIAGNTQRLDGGAMFGNAPKPIWQRWIEPDERNRIPLACRALLVREADRLLLFETGIGAFFEPKLKDRFGVVEAHHVLLESLAAAGVTPDDVDIVVLSHLHFDHAGGLLTAWEQGAEPQLIFPRARFVVGAEAWARARNPHSRDRASFVPALNALLTDSGRLEVVDKTTSPLLGAGYWFHPSNGHTLGMLVTEIEMPDGPVMFAADLIPGMPWVHLPITMGYDRFPERLIDEKTTLLEEVVLRSGRIFYTHDPVAALSGVARDERGRYSAVDGRESFVDLDR